MTDRTMSAPNPATAATSPHPAAAGEVIARAKRHDPHDPLLAGDVPIPVRFRIRKTTFPGA